MKGTFLQLPGGAGGQDSPTKIHVGSLPATITEEMLREEFSRFGAVTDVHLRTNCEPGRLWAFVTFELSDDAQLAKECTDKELMFPGSLKPCEVTMAKNQGLGGAPTPGGAPPRPAAPPAPAGPRKILVGSLPDGVDDDLLRAAFSEYGTIVETFIKPNCAPGRQWAFVTFATSAEANLAKVSTDRTLLMPGSDKPCEVLFARPEVKAAPPRPAPAPGAWGGKGGAAAAAGSTCKIFVGSMPGDVTDEALRAEFCQYGHVVETMLKRDCPPGRQWGFVVFARPEQAMVAKEATDRLLMFPGADRPCEVMLAKNHGANGQQFAGAPPPVATPYNPNAPPPFDIRSTTWRLYYSPEGLPYYHDAASGVTQWERPSDLPPVYGAAPAAGPGPRRGPY